MMIMKKYITPFLLIGFLNIRSSHCFESCNYKPRVAVIGAGIGGASASHFLTELFDKNVDIDIYESKIIGGRLATIKFGDEEYEAGGAIIHPRNKYMKDFVKFLNLYPRPPVGSTFGIWNGKEFVFEESSWDSVTLFKLLYRYGLDPFHLHRYVGAILDDFERIYELQEKNIGYENVTALIGAMNKEFITLLETSIKDHLTNLGYGSRLIDELVEATLVVNYGQDTDVQSFVACVSVAGAGFDLWAVKGGNKEVPKHLILKNRQVSVIHSAVEKIYRHSVKHATKYEIFYKEKDQDNVTSKFYDIVIIAAPMTTDQEHPIKFEGFENTDLQFSGEYQTTFATFVSGDVNPSYFGLEEEMGVLSCDPIETKISSIGQLSSVEGTKNNITKIYKIFSRQKLDDSILNKMFSQVYEIKEITWKAYPRYSSTSRHDKFKLDDALYYVNAIEWAASAMEMSAIGGRNVAILAYNNHQQKCSSATINKLDMMSLKLSDSPSGAEKHMEMFRRDHRRPFYTDERNEFRRMRPHAPPFHPQQRYESYDAPYLEEIPAGPIRPRRRMPMPQYYEEESSSHLDNYRSYQSSEPDSGPKPLLPPETIEKLRANLHMVNQRLNRYQNQDEDQYDDRYENRFGDRYDDQYQDRNEVRYQDQYDDRYEDRYDVRYEDQYEEVCAQEADPYEPRQGPSSIGMGALDPNEYVQEEEVTKKTIEEIIMVAQALREKLERREAAAQMPETRKPIDFHDEAIEPFQHQRPRQPLLETPVAVPDPPTSTEVVNKSSAKIPSLLEIKPKIPSLLEIRVEPPPEVEYFQPQVEYFHENVEPYNRYIPQRRGTRDLCWNCNKIGHRYENCRFPLKEFCFRCGKQGFNDETCPNCP